MSLALLTPRGDLPWALPLGPWALPLPGQGESEVAQPKSGGQCQGRPGYVLLPGPYEVRGVETPETPASWAGWGLGVGGGGQMSLLKSLWGHI